MITVGALREISGNHNGFFDPGETFGFNLTIENNTGATLAGIAAHLQKGNGYVVGAGDANFPDIAASERATTASELTFQIEASAACGSEVVLNIDVGGGGRSAFASSKLNLGRLEGSPENLRAKTLPVAIPSKTTTERPHQFQLCSVAEWHESEERTRGRKN